MVVSKLPTNQLRLWVCAEGMLNISKGLKVILQGSGA